MTMQVLEGSQSGLTVDEIHLAVCDEWGFNSENNRFKNATKRRINRAIRTIQLRDPRKKLLRVVNAEGTLTAGITEYNVALPQGDGGFGWAGCTEIANLRLPALNSYPLEMIDLETFRERAPHLGSIGPSGAWARVDGTRFIIYPSPDQDYTVNGDYFTDIPSLTTGQLAWPRTWDEALLAGVNYLTAMARYKENRGPVETYLKHWEFLLDQIDANERTDLTRPGRAVVTRALSSRRSLPHDNSTDLRWRS